MKSKKSIRRIALGALVLSLIPYQVKQDKETGAFEIRSLLWGWRKTPPAEGEDKASITFAIPSFALPKEDPKEYPKEDPKEDEEA